MACGCSEGCGVAYCGGGVQQKTGKTDTRSEEASFDECSSGLLCPIWGPLAPDCELQGLLQNQISLCVHRHDCLDLNVALLCSQCMCLLMGHTQTTPMFQPYLVLCVSN